MNMDLRVFQEAIAACVPYLSRSDAGEGSSANNSSGSVMVGVGNGNGNAPLSHPPPAKQLRRGRDAVSSFGGCDEVKDRSKTGRVEGEKSGISPSPLNTHPSTGFKVTSPTEIEQLLQQQIQGQQDEREKKQELQNSKKETEEEKKQRFSQIAFEFGYHRFYAGDLSIIMNLYKGKICINMRKYSRDGKVEEAVTINPDEFMWLTQSFQDSPKEGEYNRIECFRNPQGFWTISRLDGVKNVRLERVVVISPHTYKQLLEKKSLICEKVMLAKKMLGCDETDEVYREMIVFLAREEYNQRKFSEDGRWGEEMEKYQAKSCLESVKFELLKAIFAACDFPRTDSESTLQLIGFEEKRMVEDIISGEVSVRAKTMFSTFLGYAAPVVNAFGNPRGSAPPQHHQPPCIQQ